MSKVDVDYPPVYRGKSKIPTFQHQQSPVTMENGGQRPSRLMQLQSNYQQRLMKEKEEKLIQMYEENQKRALHRVNSKGNVRDFFNERRKLEQNGNMNQMPSINQHYRQTKQEVKPNYGNGRNPRLNSGSGIQQNMATVGRDKSRPLAPIERNNGNSGVIPQRPQLHGRPWTKDNILQERKSARMPGPKSAPSTVVQNSPVYTSSRISPDEDPSFHDPPQKPKFNGNKARAKPPTGKKPVSDFQKWQMEQDQARAERLKKVQPREATPKYEYEDSDEEEDDEEQTAEIQRKQQQLMAKIAAQQAELERMRIQRAKEEEDEKKEMERRRKREEERRRKMREEEERRRLEEIDRRAEEALELERREKEDSARTFNRSSRRTNHYDEDDYNDEQDDDRYAQPVHYKTQPTPPPQPKPVRVQRKPVKTVVAKPSPAPPVNTNQDLSLYTQAAHDEDAYDQGNTVLVTCSNCHRKFASDRIDKHRKACGNVTKKRKVMDPSKKRVEGTDMEKYINRRSRTPPKKKVDWRKKHEEFINNIRYAKKVTEMEKAGANMADLPPPPPSDNSDYVQCKWCSRKFNPSVAERHIPKCKDIKSRPAPIRRR